MKRLPYLVRFGLPLLLAALGAGRAPAQPPQPIPVLKEWKGAQQTIALRYLAPRKLFVSDQQTWNTLWKAWRPDEPVPPVDFTAELILVETAPGQMPFVQLVWMVDFLGNVTTNQEVQIDGAPGFVYVIDKVKLGNIQSVYGIQVVDPFAQPCGEPAALPPDGENACAGPEDRGGAVTEEEAFDIGVRAYVYGYPLVTMEMTRRVMTNAAEPKDHHAPMGQFFHARAFLNASFKDVTAPNADTLYSVAWLDLSAEPYVLSYPDMKDRYFLFPILDAWTDVLASPGSRTAGEKAQAFAVVGPGWKGALPEGVKEIRSPTNLVWVIGRTYCTGTPEDYKAVHALQDRYKLVPLSAYGKPYEPPPGKVDPGVDMKTPVREQVNKLGPAAYFKLLARLMKDNPPAKEDAPLLAKMAKVGIEPGKDFDLGKLDPAVRKGLERGHKAGLEQIAVEVKHMGKRVNGWQITFTGDYGKNYLFRAATAFAALGANLARDAVYPVTDMNAAGKPLKGAYQYEVTFPRGKTPPVKGFWSLTLYDAEFRFAGNPLNRYNLGARDKLQANADGSVTLYVQKDSPGKEKESNWLPAPEGDFVLMLRLYWPEEAVLDGKWQPPVVKRVK